MAAIVLKQAALLHDLLQAPNDRVDMLKRHRRDRNAAERLKGRISEHEYLVKA
ncbi:MAG: hypothetical protein WAK19_13855 [Candidatus Cybelea sp.]